MGDMSATDSETGKGPRIMIHAVEQAIVFVEGQNYELGAALLRHVAHGESAGRVLTAVATYQNDDGGLGRGLEVDIASPLSNPWATRLGIIALRGIDKRPSGPVFDGIRAWLTANQDADGDWRLPDAAKHDDLAPWFAAWEHPNLNPSCCLVGLGEPIGLIDEVVSQRAAALFREKASLVDVERATFYSLLPYVEYLNTRTMPDRDQYLDAVAAAIVRVESTGGYDDASHFLDHALGGGPDLSDRIPNQLIERRIADLVASQRDDGGWPVAYGAAWEPWATTCNALHLLRHTR
jgi:hypothetical protein